MFFNSWGYLLFLSISVSLYWLTPQRYRIYLLCFFSLIFYAMWKWQFLLLLTFSAFIDYKFSQLIFKSKDPKFRKWMLVISLSINLALLIYFKYSFFLYQNLSESLSFFGIALPALKNNILLPLGISFYTFVTISYTIDIYRRVIQPINHFIVFLTFVTFWPHMIAGPILRFKELIPQLIKKSRPHWGNVSEGIQRIIFGLFKKVVLADSLAPIVNQYFSQDLTAFTATDIWVMVILFGFQIYFDFSGYSEIAIGSAKMLNIDFPENFNWPYLSKSPKEFWNRWHITLSSWIRDYLYLPLTGKKFRTKSTGGIGSESNQKQSKHYLGALFGTWLIMGFWHGANWAFAFWGLYHALLIALYRILKPLQSFSNRFPLGGWCFCFLTSMAGWIFFRSQSVEKSLFMFSKILNPFEYLPHHLFANHQIWLTDYLLAISVIFGMLIAYAWRRQITENLYLRAGLLMILTFLSIAFMKPAQQFIYFQF